MDYIKLFEKWSEKYKRGINCKNPKGFSQKAHCAGRKKRVLGQFELLSKIPKSSSKVHLCFVIPASIAGVVLRELCTLTKL